MIANTQCCGYGEIADIHEYKNCVSDPDDHHRQLFGSLVLLDYVFNDLLNNDCRLPRGGYYLTSAGPKLGGDAIRHFKEVVAEHSLGFFYETPPIRNPNTGNTVQQFLWIVDWEELLKLGFDFANQFPEYARSETRRVLVGTHRARKLSKTCGVFPEPGSVVTFENYPDFTKRSAQDQFEWYKNFAKKRAKKTT